MRAPQPQSKLVTLNPIYGMSYPQLGEASRYLHKSQGMGNDIPVASRLSHLKLIHSAVETNSNNLFAGVPYDFHAWADIIPAANVSEKVGYITKPN